MNYNTGGFDTSAVPDAMTALANQQEQIANLDKSSQYFIKGMGGDDWLQQQGVNPTAVDNGSAMDRINFVKGYMQTSMAKEQQQRIAAQTQDFQAQADQRTAMANEKDADTAAGQTAADIARTYGQIMQGDPDDPDAPTPTPYQAMQQAMAKLPPGADANRVFPKVLDSIQKWNQLPGSPGAAAEDNPLTVDKTSLPGASIVKTKRGNEFQIVPNAPDTTQGAQAVKDTDGSVLGYRVPTGNPKTPFAFTKTADLTEDQRDNLVQKHMAAIPPLLSQYNAAVQQGNTNAASAFNDMIGEHRDAIAGLKAPGGAATKGAKSQSDKGTVTPVVKSQADYDALKSGDTYQDAAGNVRKKK